MSKGSDWLSLSLKIPTEQAPIVVGVTRDDFRLSHDINFQLAPLSDDSEKGEKNAGNEATVSSGAPYGIINSADLPTSGPLLGDVRGPNKECLSVYNSCLGTGPDSIDQDLQTHICDESLKEIMTCSIHSVVKDPISLHHRDKEELTDFLLGQVACQKVKGGPCGRNQQFVGYLSFDVKEDALHQSSIPHPISWSSEQADICKVFGRHVLGTDNQVSTMDVSSQQHERERRMTLSQEVDSMDGSSFVKTNGPSSFGWDSAPSFVGSLAELLLSNREGRSQYLVLKVWNSVLHLSKVFTDEEVDIHKQRCTAQVLCSCLSICSPLNNKLGSSANGVPLPLSGQLPEHVSFNPLYPPEQPWSPNLCNFVIELIDTLVVLGGQKGKLESVFPFQMPTTVPMTLVLTECLHHHLPVCNRVELSNLQLLPSDNTYISDHRNLLQVKLCKPSQLLLDLGGPGNAAHYDFEGLYINDVACCSTKLPPKQARKVAYAQSNVDKITYAHAKNANLVQVQEVGFGNEVSEGNLWTRCCRSGVDMVNLDDERGFINLQTDYPKSNMVEESGEDNIKDLEQELRESGMHLGELCHSNQASPLFPIYHASELEQVTNCQRRKLRKFVLEDSESFDSDTSGEVRRFARTSQIKLKAWEKWQCGIQCDLCSAGPSLSLGDWFAWCCGLPSSRCHCPELRKVKKQMAIGFCKTRKIHTEGKKRILPQWSGQVHKMCALWSSEVFEKDCAKEENHLWLLDAAVKRGNNVICRDPKCKKAGATLGCRVKSCRRSYHYPCAERLASRCLLRMWDCLTIPVACMNHRYVEFEVDRAKEKHLPANMAEFEKNGRTVLHDEQHYFGSKLLCEDISEGQEAVRIPCTNDVDDDPLPKIKYITKCWCKGGPVESLHPVGTALAKGCQGCSGPQFDSWAASMSVHILGAAGSRKSDVRLDWQSEYMYGRLPYNAYGLLQLGAESKDIVECNSRCTCGPQCNNRELQKGLQVSLELFKTVDRGWGVRSLEQIPRGRFVVEYVGDVLTQAEAEEQAEKYDENQLSYLFNLDHPGVDHEHMIVLDGIHKSNVARFINHSCEGNLMIYRVYSETTELRYFRIGMYAIQDIEVGDELSYDYNYAVNKEWNGLPVADPTSIRCCCGALSCRNWLWLGGNDSQLKH